MFVWLELWQKHQNFLKKRTFTNSFELQDIPKSISKMKESCPHQVFWPSNGSGMYVLVYNWAFIITLTYPEIGWDDVVA